MDESLTAVSFPSPRKYAVGMAWAAGVCLLFGVSLVALDAWTIGTLALRWTVVAAVLASSVPACARLRTYCAGQPPERLPVVHGLATTALVGVAMLAVWFFLQGTSIGRGAGPAFAMQAVVIGGATLVGASWRRRVGTSLHCPDCEYEFAYADADRAPRLCSECGCEWLGRLNRGRRVRSLRLVVLGVVGTVGAFFVFNPSTYLGWLAPHLPTPALYWMLYVQAPDYSSAWTELGTRTLTEARTRTMA